MNISVDSLGHQVRPYGDLSFFHRYLTNVLASAVRHQNPAILLAGNYYLHQLLRRELSLDRKVKSFGQYQTSHSLDSPSGHSVFANSGLYSDHAQNVLTLDDNRTGLDNRHDRAWSEFHFLRDSPKELQRQSLTAQLLSCDHLILPRTLQLPSPRAPNK